MKAEYMVRGIGCLFILFSCCALGEQAAERLKQHRSGLKQLQNWLCYFRGKLWYEGATVEEALRESADLAGAPFSIFFCRVADRLHCRDGHLFSEIWKEEAAQCRKKFAFGDEEYADLIRLGTQLGQMDRELQLRAVSVYEDRLEAALRASEEEITVKEKLYRSLGFMAGCFMIILIW